MNTPLKRFFPVIHCVCPYEEQGIGHVLANARAAFTFGADGIFLIGHGMGYEEVLYLYEQVRKQYPQRWIGVNLLDVSASKKWDLLERFAMIYPDLSAIWMDGMPERRLGIDHRIEIFGGVAFKYIDPTLNGEKLIYGCLEAQLVVDTITTSGSKTGSPPDLAKLEQMRFAIVDERRLALASGVSVDNVESFKPFVDTFLVASSITEKRDDRGGHEYLAPEKVKALAEKIHA